MPDLAVHVCAAVVAGKALRDPRTRALFYVGNCLPDLADKALRVGAFSPLSFAEVTHTPFGSACLAYAACLLFPEGWRRRALLTLLAGSVLHLLLDTCKSNLGYGVVAWGFPFSLERTEWDLFPPEASASLLLPWAVGAALAAELMEALLRRRA